MRAIGRIRNEYRFQTLIGAVLAALLLAASPAPTLSAEAGNNWVGLAWTESANATAYEWRMSTDGGATWGVWNDMPENAFRERVETMPFLTNGTAYTFQVRAKRTHYKINYFGERYTRTSEYRDPSNAVTATPTA